MEKKECILNDQIVAEALAKHAAEMEELAKPVTRADAELYVKSLDDWDLSKIMPKGTIVGVVSFAVKRGARQSYGFVRCSGYQDVFVSPLLMDGLKDDTRVAVLVKQDAKPYAERIVDVWKYYSWHEDEILASATKELEAKRDRVLKWAQETDPTNGWEKMKAKVKLLGLNLVEVRACTRSFNYGGRGEDTYIFAEGDNLTPEKAEEVLTALGTRHASTANDGPYDHGHDYVGLLPDHAGFVNRWTGPFTD